MGRHVGIVGATGLVGEIMRSVLAEREFPVESLRLFASARSAGKSLRWKHRDIVVEDAATADYSGLDIVFFSAGASTSKRLAPVVAAAGAVVVDNSSAWRGDRDVPLVVAEVNPHALGSIPKGIVANPNCTTMAAMPVLKPLHEFAGLRRMVVSTYQAVSGGGIAGVRELEAQVQKAGADSAGLVRDGGAGDFPPPRKWSVPIAFSPIRAFFHKDARSLQSSSAISRSMISLSILRSLEWRLARKRSASKANSMRGGSS